MTMLLITEHGAASALRVRDKQVRRMVREGAIPFVKLPCGEIRFNPASLERWAADNEHIPETESDAQ